MAEQNRARVLRDGLSRIVRAMGFLEGGRAACCDLSIGGCHCLVALGRAGELSVTELSERLGVDKSTASRLADSLVTDGLAVRRPGTTDRRYVSLALTEEGRSRYRGIETLMDKYFLQVLEKLPEARRGTVAEAVALLAEALETGGAEKMMRICSKGGQWNKWTISGKRSGKSTQGR